MFRKFDPIRRMIVSRDTGLINDYFSVTKGQLIDLVHFATLGEMDNDVPETYKVKDKDGKEKWVIKEELKNYVS